MKYQFIMKQGNTFCFVCFWQTQKSEEKKKKKKKKKEKKEEDSDWSERIPVF